MELKTTLRNTSGQKKEHKNFQACAKYAVQRVGPTLGLGENPRYVDHLGILFFLLRGGISLGAPLQTVGIITNLRT